MSLKTDVKDQKKVGHLIRIKSYSGVEMLDVLSQLLKENLKLGGILLQNHHELYPHITKQNLM